MAAVAAISMVIEYWNAHGRGDLTRQRADVTAIQKQFYSRKSPAVFFRFRYAGLFQESGFRVFSARPETWSELLEHPQRGPPPLMCGAPALVCATAPLAIMSVVTGHGLASEAVFTSTTQLVGKLLRGCRRPKDFEKRMAPKPQIGWLLALSRKGGDPIFCYAWVLCSVRRLRSEPFL